MILCELALICFCTWQTNLIPSPLLLLLLFLGSKIWEMGSSMDKIQDPQHCFEGMNLRLHYRISVEYR